jgi:hypothetical protein
MIEAFHMFHIKIQNSEGNISIIDAFVEKEDNFYEIYIGDTHITVIENEEEAILQDLEYRKTCDIYGNLEESYGTHLMLKGALMFMIQKYPFVKKINLSDVAQKKHTRIYLTPKRILLGKKGWYEEYFGAIPTNKSKTLIKKL